MTDMMREGFTAPIDEIAGTAPDATLDAGVVDAELTAGSEHLLVEGPVSADVITNDAAGETRVMRAPVAPSATVEARKGFFDSTRNRVLTAAAVTGAAVTATVVLLSGGGGETTTEADQEPARAEAETDVAVEQPGDPVVIEGAQEAEPNGDSEVVTSQEFPNFDYDKMQVTVSEPVPLVGNSMEEVLIRMNHNISWGMWTGEDQWFDVMGLDINEDPTSILARDAEWMSGRYNPETEFNTDFYTFNISLLSINEAPDIGDVVPGQPFDVSYTQEWAVEPGLRDLQKYPGTAIATFERSEDGTFTLINAQRLYEIKVDTGFDDTVWIEE